MINVLIYLRDVKKPFEVCFESASAFNKFNFELKAADVSIVTVGPLSFSKSEFKYCLQK